MSRTRQRVKRYAELRGNPENSGIKSSLDNINWYQEKGTSSIEARPFMRPAAERVNANTGAYIERIATAQGMDITTQEDAVRAAALAVQAEGKRIADEKDVRDTGDLIASITIAKVR